MNTILDSKSEGDALSRYTVIMVDDELNILQTLKRCFSREKFRIICANSGAEGLKLVAETANVAVIVSDQRMPGMNGSEFLTRSREFAPDAIRMLLTGFSDIETTVVAMNEGGATHYIGKPWEETMLLQTVRDCVTQYHLVRENLRQQEVIKTQYEELEDWNRNLKERVLTQTGQIRTQLEELKLLSRRQEEKYVGTIAALAALIDMRDPRSRLHAANTAALSVSIATRMGLSKTEVETIRTAALLHDIGKNAMSDVTLAIFEDGLNEEDRRHYSEHPVLAQTAIDTIEELRPAGVLIRHHHERYDGSGFPDGLAGTDIPLGSAIISLADRCDREINSFFGVNAVSLTLEKMATQVGTGIAPQLFPCLEQAAHDLYDGRIKERGNDLIQLEVIPAKLRIGMILTRDLFSASGLFLLEAGSELNVNNIRSLQRIFALDPLRGGIHIGMHTG